MALERELKFRVAPGVAQTLGEHPLLLLAAAPRTRGLHTLYFDTPELQLGAAGLVLRLRDDGHARVVTVKARGADALGAERGEWEWPSLDSAGTLLGPRDLRHALARTALGGLGASAAALGASLAPRFQTRFERTAWDMEWQGARIELALDRGECLAWRDGGEFSAPLCEVELEVVHGRLAQAWDLAWTLGQDLPLLLSPLDKARRAVALLRGEPLPVLPEPGALSRDATMRQAARRWLQTACAQLAVWGERIEQGDDAHAVHQFRVVSRRLRTALRWLSDELARAAARWLRAELRWAHQLAGLVRDADVALELLGALGSQAAEAAAQGALLAGDLAAARQRHRRALRAYLQGPRFGRLLMALGRCGDASAVSARAGALRRMAEQALETDERQWRGALAACQALRPLAQAGLPRPEQAAALHRLRIASKRLRLSADRMAVLLPRKARQRFLDAGRMATALQTHLGAWHDADRLLQGMAGDAASSTALRQWLGERAVQALQAAESALRQPPRAGAPQARRTAEAAPAVPEAIDEAPLEPLLEAPRGPAGSVEAPPSGAQAPSEQAVEPDVVR